VPLNHPTLPPGLLYLGCEYEAYAVDFKVFVTQPNTPVFVDLAMTGRQHTKVTTVRYCVFCIIYIVVCTAPARWLYSQSSLG
jgi:hypothetical protein